MFCFPVSHSFTFADKFGDGWGGARLFLLNSYNDYWSFAPTCTQNPVRNEVCFNTYANKSGDTLTAVLIGDSFFPWEVCLRLRYSL